MKINRVIAISVCGLLPVIALSLLLACQPVELVENGSVQVTDQLGRVVVLDKVPERIISLAPSNTEIVYALGLADRLVAVTDYCDYPSEAKEKPSIGGFSTPNIEEIVALSPDLVLATSRHEERIIPQLEEQGLTVFAVNPTTLDEVLITISLVGEVAGVEKNAAELIADMRQRIKAVTDKTAKLSPAQRTNTFYVLWHDPLKTAGAGTLQDELMQKAGGSNIGAEVTGYANISLEVVLSENPEVIIAGTSHGSNEDQVYQFAATESRLGITSARQSHRVHAIDSDLSSRAGPRIVEGLEQMAVFIHPEMFK
ncbi:ABC transporter substrate-binding protein [Chloroflexota bacterium]